MVRTYYHFKKKYVFFPVKITSIGTRKSKKYKSGRVRRRRKTVKKVKSTPSCKSSSKNLTLTNDVTSEDKTNFDETSRNIPIVIEKDEIKENTKKIIKPARVEGKDN